MYDFDVVCVGAGSGGCACAMRSADLGKKVALVEYRERGTGGTCVTRGCIPTKVLLKSAQVYSEVLEAKKYGVIVDGCRVDMKAMHQKKNAAINNLKFSLDNVLIKPRGIERIAGRARLIDAHTLEIESGEDKRAVTAENIIIATGSEPALIPAFNIDRERIITSDEALNLMELPGELIIVGAGALGLEFAYLFHTLGVRVSVVEMMPHVVPAMDDGQVTGAIEDYLKKLGITVQCGCGIQGITREGERVNCMLSDGSAIQADMALVAIGRSLNTGELGLSEAGVDCDEKGRIKVNARMQTSIPNIYAVGDIVEGPQLSHKAQRQGIVAAEAIAGMDTRMSYDVIPWAIFTQPEIAGVGVTKAEAERAGREVIEGRRIFSSNEKAMSMQKTTGIIKIVAGKEDHIVLGGQAFGADASVLIAEIAMAVEHALTLEMIADSVHAHPTLSEIVMETAKDALGKAFHKG